jgi:hypothetical protein
MNFLVVRSPEREREKEEEERASKQERGRARERVTEINESLNELYSLLIKKWEESGRATLIGIFRTLK